MKKRISEYWLKMILEADGLTDGETVVALISELKSFRKAVWDADNAEWFDDWGDLAEKREDCYVQGWEDCIEAVQLGVQSRMKSKLTEGGGVDGHAGTKPTPGGDGPAEPNQPALETKYKTLRDAVRKALRQSRDPNYTKRENMKDMIVTLNEALIEGGGESSQPKDNAVGLGDHKLPVHRPALDCPTCVHEWYVITTQSHTGGTTTTWRCGKCLLEQITQEPPQL